MRPFLREIHYRPDKNITSTVGVISLIQAITIDTFVSMNNARDMCHYRHNWDKFGHHISLLYVSKHTLVRNINGKFLKKLFDNFLL